MKRLAALCLVLLLTTTFSGSSIAQEDEGEDVLVIANAGDWWAAPEYTYTDPLLLNFCGNIEHGELQVSPMAMSPDGDYVAYLTYPPEVTAVMEAEGGIGGPVATNVRLCDGWTSTDSVLPSQPTDFAFSSQANIYHTNPLPTWSPDSSQLAWAFWRFPQNDFILAIYTLETGEISYTEGVIPPQYGIPNGLDAYWGQSGIAAISYVYNPDAGAETASILLFDSTGRLLKERVLGTYGEVDLPSHYLWFDDKGTEHLALIYEGGLVSMWDPNTDEINPFSGWLEYYSPEGSIAPTYRLTFHYKAYNNTVWEVWSSDGEWITELPFAGSPRDQQIAISPSTNSIAYIADNVAWVWSSGVTESVWIPTDPDGLSYGASLIWAPMLWRSWY